MKVVVLAGGLSTERDVSLSTGTQICKALREKGYEVFLLDSYLGWQGTPEEFFNQSVELLEEKVPVIDPDLDAVKALRTEQTDSLFGPNVVSICRMAEMVYIGLHGADGENGKIQAALDVLGIPYTGSDYLGSALAMDKGLSKMVLENAGIPTPKGYSLKKGMKQTMGKISFPCVVKPCCGGSSVGVSIPEKKEDFQQALELGFRYEDEILVEEYIKGREFSVGILDGKSLPIIEIIPKEGFYDFRTKYQEGMAQDICPAKLDDETAQKMMKLAVQAYEALRLKVYARIDFLMDQDGKLYCLEANTLPGMTPTSLLPQEALAAGMDYSELCEQIIQLSKKRIESI